MRLAGQQIRLPHDRDRLVLLCRDWWGGCRGLNAVGGMLNRKHGHLGLKLQRLDLPPARIDPV